MPGCHPLLKYNLYVLIVMFSTTTAAETPAQDDQTVTTTSENLSATLQYESALSTYQSYSNQPVQSWRDANEHVGNIGGWRTYLREAATEDASESDAPPSLHEHQHGEAQP